MLVHAVKLLLIDAELTIAELVVVFGQPPGFVCKVKKSGHYVISSCEANHVLSTSRKWMLEYAKNRKFCIYEP